MGKQNYSDYNLRTVSTKELSQTLKGTIEFGGNCFIVGRRGSGKTMVSKQAIKEAGCKELYWNTSLSDRSDIAGFPDIAAPHKKDRYVNFLLPKFFEPLLEGDQPVVILFDELDKADPSILAPLLELLQEHTINGTPLPNLKATIATGNLISEGGSRPPLPLIDRSEAYLLEPNLQHWIDWGLRPEIAIHPSIIAYLKDHSSDLVGEHDIGEAYTSTSPRSWHNTSRMLHHGEKHKWPKDLLMSKVAGYLGRAAGLKYQAYFDHYQVLIPMVEKVMEGEKVKGFNKLEVGRQLSGTILLCHRAARLLDEMKAKKQKEIPLPVLMIGRFLNREIDPELALVGLRSAMGAQRMIEHLDDCKEYAALMDKLIEQVGIAA